MKKAILCFPFVTCRQTQYPTGVYKIASFCRDFYDVIVFDQRVDGDVISKISEFLSKNGDVLCLGLSVMTGEQIKYAIDISKKFHGKIKIVWGGLHPTILPQQTVKNEFIDYIIIGEGEEAFLNLLHHLSGRNVYKKLFLSKDDGNRNYNYIKNLIRDEYVDFHKYKIREEYFVERDGFKRAFTLETSRGCPYRCSYCHNSIFRKPYRALSPSNVLHTINILEDGYSIDGVVFQEDNFFADIRRVNEIVGGLIHKNNIGWKANSRINYFYKLVDDKNFMRKLLLSDCRVLQFGIESGSQKVIKMIKKKIDLNQVIAANRKLSNYPISIRYNFIIGFPGETESDIKATFELIDKLLKDNPHAESPFLNIYNPYPGTLLYNEALKYGFREPKDLLGWSRLNWNKLCLDFLPAYTKDFIKKKSIEYLKNSKYLCRRQ